MHLHLMRAFCKYYKIRYYVVGFTLLLQESFAPQQPQNRASITDDEVLTCHC